MLFVTDIQAKISPCLITYQCHKADSRLEMPQLTSLVLTRPLSDRASANLFGNCLPLLVTFSETRMRHVIDSMRLVEVDLAVIMPLSLSKLRATARFYEVI